MATSLRTQIQMAVDAVLTADSPLTGGVQAHIEKVITLVNGTGAGAADKVYFASRTLGATSTEILDLAGVLADPYGSTLTFAKVKLIAIVNTDTTDGDNLYVGPDATAGWGTAGFVLDASDRVIVPADGCLLWYDPNGVAVTAGSADELYVATPVGAVVYKVLIVGTSA